MKLKPILLIIVIFALVNQVYALGITPSHVDVIFEPSLEKTIQLKVINDGYKEFDAFVYAEGELAEYVTIDNPIVRLSKDQDSKIISYKINLPENFEKKGAHSANIVIREIPKETKGKTTVTASIAVASVLKVIVPYEGKYAEIRLFIPKFKNGKESNFSVEVRNLGTEKILEAQAVIEIYDPLKNKITTITTNKISIKSKEENLLTASWTPDVGSGNYYAVATLVYDKLNAMEEKLFTVGELLPEIISISVSNFKLGGIAKFDILVKNNWNEELKGVFAETSVKDKKGEIYTSFKTISLDIPEFGSQEFNAYWDTSKVIPGTYNLDIILNYLGEKTEKIFEIFVEYDKIRVSVIGQVIGEQEKPSLLKSVNTLTLLVLMFIVVNIVVVIIIVKLLKRSKKIKKQ
ncbi:hypothetical protein COY26_02300 [Candidatus Woesearchaeota archaeon CG_4_10_14_0_2_um_filter_33_10]|nr:MAG: hypothetical protein COY26_02300 [Candidatus Woesearchaeota archaeon CG_4_10_14_0_2_um_filter_33_10]